MVFPVTVAVFSIFWGASMSTETVWNKSGRAPSGQPVWRDVGACR